MAETEKGRANHLTGADSTPFAASHLPKFLIANLELEFFLNISKSIKYNFLIANKLHFCAPVLLPSNLDSQGLGL